MIHFPIKGTEVLSLTPQQIFGVGTQIHTSLPFTIYGFSPFILHPVVVAVVVDHCVAVGVVLPGGVQFVVIASVHVCNAPVEGVGSTQISSGLQIAGAAHATSAHDSHTMGATGVTGVESDFLHIWQRNPDGQEKLGQSFSNHASHNILSG